MVQDRNQRMGFQFDAGSPYTDPINSGTAKYWKFGRLSKKLGDLSHPIELHNWEPIYKSNARTPSELELPDVSLRHGLAFFPTNLVPLYMMLGKHTDPAGDDEHEITPITDGQLPSFTTRSESTDGSGADKIISAIGCKANQLTGYLDFIQGFTRMSQTLQYTALTSLPNDDTNPSHNLKHTTGTKYPTQDGTMTGTQVTTPFRKDTNFAFHWDSSDSDDDLTSQLLQFNYIIEKVEDLEDAENQREIDFIADGNFIIGFSGTVIRDNAKVLKDDYDARTQHDAYLLVYAGSTNFMKLTWDDVGLVRCGMGYPFRGHKTYAIQGIAEGITVRGTDGVDQTEFYS
jgi:uncharacterized protein (UPF0335 family)